MHSNVRPFVRILAIAVSAWLLVGLPDIGISAQGVPIEYSCKNVKGTCPDNATCTGQEATYQGWCGLVCMNKNEKGILEPAGSICCNGAKQDKCCVGGSNPDENWQEKCKSSEPDPEG
jgi:hypothetical protein